MGHPPNVFALDQKVGQRMPLDRITFGPRMKSMALDEILFRRDG